MTITLNGTTGITTPAETVQGDLTTTGNTVLGNASTDTLNVANGGLVKDSSGNLGLGVTPSAWYSSGKWIQVNSNYSVFGGISGQTIVGNNWYLNGSGADTYANSAAATTYVQNAGSHVWFNAPSGTAGTAATFTQAMTLNSSGYLLVGTSSTLAYRGNLSLQVNNGATIRATDIYNGSPCLVMYSLVDTTGGIFTEFKNSSGTNIGTITRAGASTIAYNTSSDYRLKENVAPMTGALAKVSALKPVTYTWKSAPDEMGEGFIAHELAEVCPLAVTGEKDAVDEEGNPVYQGIDTSFLVATLTAAIQELKAELDTVKTELATLKGTA